VEYPTGVEWMTDLSGAAWIEDGLAEWKVSESFPVGTVVPEGFEAYARVFHPVRPNSVHPLRWSAFADERGKVAHPAMEFESLIETVDWQRPPWDELAPEWGCTPEAECRALAEVLDAFTWTPDACWFALWDGYSLGFWPEDREVVRWPTRADRRAIYSQETLEREADRARELERIPTFGTLRGRRLDGSLSEPARTYYLLRGRLEAVLGFHFGGGRSPVRWRSPNLWWPDDHAWCVGCEVDGFTSFVGGTDQAITAVVGSPHLEAMRLDGDLRFRLGVDEINGPPPDLPVDPTG